MTSPELHLLYVTHVCVCVSSSDRGSLWLTHLHPPTDTSAPHMAALCLCCTVVSSQQRHPTVKHVVHVAAFFSYLLLFPLTAHQLLAVVVTGMKISICESNSIFVSSFLKTLFLTPWHWHQAALCSVLCYSLCYLWKVISILLMYMMTICSQTPLFPVCFSLL